MNSNTTMRELVGMRRAALSLLAVVMLTACGVFRDDPVTQSREYIKSLIALPEVEYQLKRKDVAMREQASIDYLRAMRVQNVKLSYDIEDMRRPDARQREVTVSVSEKRRAGGSHERARFRVQVEQNPDGVWQVVSFQLVE